MHSSPGSYSMTTREMSGCPVTGHTEVTSSVLNRTWVTVGGAGKDSTCSTGPRALEPSRVRPETSGSETSGAGIAAQDIRSSARKVLAQ